jgi:uncharacterized RDD family membrane protein YckC
MTLDVADIELEATLAKRRYRFAAYFIDVTLFGIVYMAVSYYAWYTLLPFTPAARADPTWLERVHSYLNTYADDPLWPVQLAMDIIFGLYFYLSHVLWGQTLGKWVCHIKVVSHGGFLPTTKRAGMRAALFPYLGTVPYIGIPFYFVDTLWIFRDSRRRCLHDVLTGTIVIDIRSRVSRSTGSRIFANIAVFLIGFIVILATATLIILRLWHWLSPADFAW